MKFGKEFCDYETGYAGKCGRYSEDLSGRCDSHRGLKQRQVKKKDGSVYSKRWQSEKIAQKIAEE